MKQSKQLQNYLIVIFQIDFLPDKAIDLIDEAGSKVRLRSYTTPPNLKELEVKLEEVRKEKDAAVQSQEFEKAASLRDTEQRFVKN